MVIWQKLAALSPTVNVYSNYTQTTMVIAGLTKEQQHI